MTPMRRAGADLLALLLLFALATAALWPVVGGGEVLAGGDLVNAYLPLRHAAKEAIGAGDWPWWNPRTFAGQPMVANLNAALFYPPNLLALWIPLARWFGWSVWAHVLWGLAGAHLFLRRAGCSPGAAALGAATFWGSGFFIFNLWSCIVLFHQAGGWWPWALLGGLGWAQTLRPPWIALAGAALALAFLAGAPQVAFYAAGTVALTVLTLAAGRREWPRLVAGLVGMLALAFLLVQVQYGPSREFTAMSQRATWGSDEAWEMQTVDSLLPRSLVLALVPRLCGDPTDESLYWGTIQGFHEVVPAVMTPPLVLALLGLLGAPTTGGGAVGARLSQSRRWFIFHLVLGLLALAAAFGRHSPLFALLWKVGPGFREFRVPARLSLITVWCLAILAASAFDRWRAAAAGDRRRPWMIAGWTVAGLGLAVLIGFTLSDTRRLLLALGPAPGIEAQLPEGISPARFLATHLWTQPQLVTTAREALIGWALALTLTGAGVALWVTWPRLWAAALGLLLAAMLQTVPPLSSVRTAPRDRFEETFYPRTEALEVIRGAIGDGRLLCLDSVLGHRHDQFHPELYPNRPLVHGIADARGYDPIIADAYVRWTNALAGLPADFPARGLLMMPAITLWPLLRWMNVTVIATYDPIANQAVELLAQDSTGLLLYRVREPGGPARWVPEVVEASSDPAFNLYLVAGGRPDLFDPARQVMVHGEVPDLAYGMGASGEVAVRLVARGFGRSVFETTAPRPGFLVTDIPFHPGWRAELDGGPWPLVEGNTLWLTAPLPAGRHSVALRFAPTSLVRGALFTLTGLIAALGLALARGVKRGDPGASPPGLRQAI